MSSPPLASESVELRVGGEQGLRLKGKGDSGYRWSFAIEEGPTVIEVKRVPITRPPAAPFPTGESADELFLIRGLSVGRGRVQFALQRPWLAGKSPPVEVMVVQVTVVP